MSETAVDLSDRAVMSAEAEEMLLKNGDVRTNGSASEQHSCTNTVPSISSKKAKMMSNLSKRPPVDIAYDNLTYSVAESEAGRWLGQSKNHKMILKGLSGNFRPGELTAIMGPSGAGKSTLMNILAGCKTRNVQGEVTINGKARDLRRFRKMSCYIMQSDDSLSAHLTVGEAMEVAANLKIGSDKTDQAKKVVVDEILDTLGLAEAAHTRASMLSGGQRKRLAIALELVNNPPVMFFDEPTSGLDSSSCLQCISLLKQLAREGRTIVCTIHQPSARIFEMFDKLIILSEGRTIYRGSVQGLVPFLGTMGYQCPSYHNPADFVMEVATGVYEGNDVLDKLAAAVEAGKCPERKTTTGRSEVKITVEADGDSRSSVESNNIALLNGSDESIDDHYKTFPTSTWTQFRVLFWRTFLSIIRDATLTRLRVFSHIFVGLLIGGLYWGIGNEASKVYNNSALLFFCTLFCMFTAMMPTVMTFPLEMPTFKKEHLNYWYSMKSYYLAKSLADLPFQIAYPALYVLIVYFMTNQPLDPLRFGMFMLMCILTSLVAQSLGLVIGCACDIQTAVYMGPITTIPILLFSGESL